MARTQTSTRREHPEQRDIGNALARTIDVEHVIQEVTQETRRAFPTDALAIALADESTGELRVAHHVGFDESADALDKRLRSSWARALADARPVKHKAHSNVELTVPITANGTPLGAITLAADLADSPRRLEEAESLLGALATQSAAAIERARLVRQMERKRRLEAIGEVAAAIANELRNPLFGISSAAQLLRFRAREDPVLERNVGRILREVERLNALVGDLLDYGAPRPLTLAPGDPDAVWDEVIEGNRGLLESRAIKLERKRAEHRVKVALDRERLGEVFLNVLTNAVEAAPDTSIITLTATSLPNGGWRCALRNPGEPIPADVLARVFELFFSTKRGGTGLGLALSRRIVDEHHGVIGIDSSAEGTTLTITLPPLPASSPATR
ncbi:MAG TPA: ATP-binding protein [Gemmatimonadaceae bacterium]|nr:ATP-binding protein [Gemmatimonadaceae bacterium]